MDAAPGTGDRGATLATLAHDERRDVELTRCASCGAANGDAARSCQWCGAALPVSAAPGAAAALPPPPPGPEQPMQYTHSGVRYLLGYSATSFGIWDRERPASPVETFPRTDEGWRAAWQRYSALEPTNVDVGLGSGGPGPGRPIEAGATGFVPALGAASPRMRRTVSGSWWLLPILMGWLGGLIAWLVNRDDDPQKARGMLLVGIAVSLVVPVLFVLLNLSAASVTSR